ncbi:MAG: hypothetical protein JSR85_08220 [Proteobacteria bacterium]|nr:hypothetical protein [Pseudomonadota bacterium]
MPEITGKKQVQSRFQKGCSGNPKGRPKGSIGQAALLAKSILEENVSEICNRLVDEAKNGNIQAIRLILDRILPVRKELPMKINLPEIQCAHDVLTAINIITNAIAEGIITVSEGEVLSKIIDINLKTIETQDFQIRLEKLEAKKDAL